MELTKRMDDFLLRTKFQGGLQVSIDYISGGEGNIKNSGSTIPSLSEHSLLTVF